MKQQNRVSSKIVKASDSDLDPSMVRQELFNIESFRGRTFPSPLIVQKKEFVDAQIIHDKDHKIMFDPRPNLEINQNGLPVSNSPLLLKLACPRATLHFNPGVTNIGIVTCGGLCPGLNDVIRGLTLTAINSYHVRRVIGFRYGYWGLTTAGRESIVELTPENVRSIHRQGGTVLGSSRGGQNISEMVDTLVNLGINILFTVGGDGTQKGARAITMEIAKRGLDIAVIGIPKTIDNDLSFSHRTFGFETAVEEAVRAIRAAHAESSSHMYGVGVVKLMGRHSGFIAAQATISSALSHICLIPEMPITKDILLKLLLQRFTMSQHVVIVVAEGFGQNWEECNMDLGCDASGNKRLADIGLVVKKFIEKFLKSDKKYALSTVKYIDPSYMIRACAPNSSDAFFCSNLSTLAVHEAMAGCTSCIISQWYSNFVLIPINVAVSLRKIVAINGPLWRQVREVTVDIDTIDTKSIENNELRRELASLTSKRDNIIKKLSKL